MIGDLNYKFGVVILQELYRVGFRDMVDSINEMEVPMGYIGETIWNNLNCIKDFRSTIKNVEDIKHLTTDEIWNEVIEVSKVQVSKIYNEYLKTYKIKREYNQRIETLSEDVGVSFGCNEFYKQFVMKCLDNLSSDLKDKFSLLVLPSQTISDLGLKITSQMDYLNKDKIDINNLVFIKPEYFYREGSDKLKDYINENYEKIRLDIEHNKEIGNRRQNLVDKIEYVYGLD